MRYGAGICIVSLVYFPAAATLIMRAQMAELNQDRGVGYDAPSVANLWTREDSLTLPEISSYWLRCVLLGRWVGTGCLSLIVFWCFLVQ